MNPQVGCRYWDFELIWEDSSVKTLDIEEWKEWTARCASHYLLEEPSSKVYSRAGIRSKIGFEYSTSEILEYSNTFEYYSTPLS